jgi:hypothetical protein
MDCPAELVSHSERVSPRAACLLAFALAAALSAAGEAPAPAFPPPAGALPGGRYQQVTVDPTKTSIYIGSVSLVMPPFTRRDGRYVSDYTAKVFPFFFYNEHGHLSIEFSDEDLRRLLDGETVYFRGRAHNSGGAERRIEGRAVPESTGAVRGKIKVRVWVGRIELIFNTVYRFARTE